MAQYIRKLNQRVHSDSHELIHRLLQVYPGGYPKGCCIHRCQNPGPCEDLGLQFRLSSMTSPRGGGGPSGDAYFVGG